MRTILVLELLGVRNEPTNNTSEKYDCRYSKEEKPKTGEMVDNFIVCWI